MPRRNRSKKMKGGGFGFWPFGNSDSSSSSSNGIGSSVSNWWGSLTGSKKETSSLPYNTTATTSAYNTQAPTYTPTPVGGKHKSKRRSMKGGYTSNVPTMSLAGHAAPISGVPNAQPQAWVGKGGKRTRRRNKRYNKSYRKH